MADYWGYKNSGIKLNNKGMSLVMINTSKGEKLLEVLKRSMVVYPLRPETYNYALNKQEQNLAQTRDRNSYFSLSQRMGYEKASLYFVNTNAVSNAIQTLVRKLK